ncbi:MAG: uroporphyrinogen-III synthase [Planctomycetales bacterium]|nr:uroporphyrinogen-III synthase [Planctomycetales bacterium]
MSEANPFVVCTFESRRAEEMCSLISRQGCLPLSAPSMREIPIEHNPEAIEIIQGFLAQKFDAIILLTGVGTEALFDVARSQGLYDQLVNVLTEIPIIIRGPKPAAVLSKVGLKYVVRAPEPNTWRELLNAVDDSKFELNGKRVVVQEYGLPNIRLYNELQNRGVTVTACPVYRWALPENTEPLESAIRQTADGKVDAVLFTSANQVSSVLTVAERIGVLDHFRAATSSRTLVVSIGPTCSEALIDNGFDVHAEASPPKMGQLARAAADALKARRDSHRP